MMNIGFESENIEFKKTTGEIKEALNSIVAMLNKSGYGTVYFGVEDNGSVIGQDIGTMTLNDISQKIANNITPPISPTITLELIDDKNVIKVEFSGNQKPYSVKGKYFIRQADEDRVISTEKLKELIINYANDDIITIIEAETQDLSFNQLKTYYTMKGKNVNNDGFEENTGLYNKDKKFNLMAELLADKNDISIKVVVFEGKDKNKIKFRNEYGNQSLVLAVDQVVNYVASFNSTVVKMNKVYREEEQAFDINCFREAWINACIHTKWNYKNPPAVYIFDDRIEIISTGGLIEGLRKDEFFKGISRPINMKLQRIFIQLGFAEQTGRGIPMIIQKYGEQAFDISENYVNVTIPFNKGVLKEKKGQIETKIEISRRDNAGKVLEYIKNNASATIENIARDNGISFSYARKIIDKWKNLGVIKRVGANKNGFWEVKSIVDVEK